jgi:hypothetical protein
MGSIPPHKLKSEKNDIKKYEKKRKKSMKHKVQVPCNFKPRTILNLMHHIHIWRWTTYVMSPQWCSIRPKNLEIQNIFQTVKSKIKVTTMWTQLRQRKGLCKGEINALSWCDFIKFTFFLAVHFISYCKKVPKYFATGLWKPWWTYKIKCTTKEKSSNFCDLNNYKIAKLTICKT